MISTDYKMINTADFLVFVLFPFCHSGGGGGLVILLDSLC